MPHLTFITPAALALLVALPLLWAFTLVAPRRVAAWRFWAGLLLRSVILAALVLSLAGAQLVQPVHTLTSVFLLDLSDSIAPAQRDRATAYVESALGSLPAGDRAAVVVFGASALVERAPASLARLGRLNSIPITTRTNIQDALQLGIALLPADSQKRIVLVSDGGENSGRATDAAQLALARGVPIDVVSLPSQRGADVIVNALSMPSIAREGQEVAVTVAIGSNVATTSKLQVYVDGQLAHEQGVTIAPGPNTFTVRVPAGVAGFRRVEARIEPQADTEPQNNSAGAFTEVQGPPRVLVIASEANRAANLTAALQSTGVKVDLRAPDTAPARLDQLNSYTAVIVVDTPASAMPRALLQALPAYVRDLGRGLAMIGGAESFGAGGYRRAVKDPSGASIEDALPVNLDPLDTAQQPDLALMLVIDRSGSMAEGGSGSRTKLDLAKEAVYQASFGLTQRDQLGLVVFDDSAETVLPLQKLPPATQIEQALNSFSDGGGTDIRPGMELAAQAITAANAKIKHIILMTDGQAPDNYGELVDQLHGAGVTVTTVAIGDDADPKLESIAKRGGGRYYLVQKVEEIPRIFLQETVVVAGRDIIEGRFEPEIALQSPVVRGLGGLPPLYGYNGTEIKQAARAILVTPDGKPVLAQWQYGLGRAVAWTSDLKGQWARDWVGWDQFPRFVSGLTDILIPPRGVDTLDLRATTAGEQAAIELNATDAQGRALNQVALQGKLISPDNANTDLSFTQIAPGRYRAVTAADTPGVYLAQVAAADASGQPIGTATTGVVVSYSPEYSETRDNPQLLHDLASISGGRIDPPASAVFDTPTQVVGSVSEIGLQLLWLALLLWPLDIALRRLHLRLNEFAPSLAALRARRNVQHGAAGPESSMARLSAAKQRARSPSRSIPELRARPIATPPSGIPPAETKPGPAAAPGSNEPANSAPPATPPSGDEQLARLLAAKQRARKQRGE